MRLISRVFFFAVLLLGWFAPPAYAVEQPITVRVYRFADGRPHQDDSQPLCEGSITSTDLIDFDWGGGIVAGCAHDQVVVHFSGSLTISERMMLVVQHDDGASLLLDGNYWIDAYWDTGCAWDVVWVEPGVYQFDLWFYENGGGACARLWYTNSDQYQYQPVPADWFSPTTTSTTTTSTTTTTELATTTEPATTATEPTTTTTEVTTSLPLEVSTTTTATPLPTDAPSTTSEPVPSTTSARTTTSTTTTTAATTSVPIETVPATTTSRPSTTTVETTTTTTSPASPEAILDTIENLDTISDEQISALIEDIANANLTDEQAAQIAEALSDAPDTIKQAFQETVNVFSGQFDNYVPTGSTISVSQRRTIVAASGTMTVAAVPSRRRR